MLSLIRKRKRATINQEDITPQAQDTTMRKVLLPFIAAVCLFIFGIFILNMQLWYSSRVDGVNGARYAVKNINNILDEASQATRIAIEVAEKGCNPQTQYLLGAEAALQPHLRTILIVRDGEIWCSSLPGKRPLITHIPNVPETPLFLTSAKNTTDGMPILIYQTHIAKDRIFVTLSDRHIREALNIPLKDMAYSLRVGDVERGLTGDVKPASDETPSP